MGTLTFDGSTVVLEKKARGATRIPVGSIQAVTIEKAGIGMRAIRFAVGGGTVSNGARNTHKEFASDPYALTFKAKAQPEFEAMVSLIEARRAEHLPS